MESLGHIAVRNLSVTFCRTERWGHVTRIQALRGLSLAVHRGEVLAVVGDSGGGKSVLAHALLGILPSNAEIEGDILYDGESLTSPHLARLRGRQIALIPQSVAFLDPLVRVKHAVRWAARRSGLGKAAATMTQQEAFLRMGLSEEAANSFPFQLSGGMIRRVLLAMATVGNASVLVADEPTPGLHPEAVSDSMRLLRELADEGRAVLIISHDVTACLGIADRVAVFLDGAVVESAAASAFTASGTGLKHPYSLALWDALPDNGFSTPADSSLHGVSSSELAIGSAYSHKPRAAVGA